MMATATGGFTELHRAAYMGDDHLVSSLLSAFGDDMPYIVGRTAEKGLTMLDLAALGGRDKVIRVIVQDYAHSIVWSSHQNDCDGKKTSLHYAVLGKSVTAVSYLAEYYSGQYEEEGVIDMQDEDGWTALMLASGDEEMCDAVVALIQCGANLQLCNKDGDTALLIACRANAVQCAQALLQAVALRSPPAHPFYLARANACNHAGERSLDCAAEQRSCPQLLSALLAAQAIPGLRRANASGFTALHCAARAGWMDNCETLVRWLEENQKLAEDNLALYLDAYPGSAHAQSAYFTLYRDGEGRLPSQVAQQSGHADLAQYLTLVEARHRQRLQQQHGLFFV